MIGFSIPHNVGRFTRAVGYAVLLMAMAPWTAGAEPPTVVDCIVAVVNEDIITQSELNRSLQLFRERLKTLGYPPEKQRQMLLGVRDQVLNSLIDEKLTDQEIKRLGVSISEKEIDRAVVRIQQENRYSDEELRQTLEREGSSLEAYRKSIRDQILRNKLVNLEVKSKIVITAQDIRSYYDSHPEIYGGEKKFHLRNIILPVPSAASEKERSSIGDKANEAMERLLSGMPFEEAARLYSESMLSGKGGDLGVFGVKELSPQIQEALRPLKEGQFTSVLDTDQGFQIYYVDKILSTPAKPLEEVTAEIEEKLYLEIVDQKFRSWVEDLRGRSHIRIIQ